MSEARVRSRALARAAPRAIRPALADLRGVAAVHRSLVRVAEAGLEQRARGVCAVYVMQSYSDQQVDQDEAGLAGLGDVLAPPAGWSFRVRVPQQDLRVAAVDASPSWSRTSARSRE